jgi:alkanesulfonate monooxygenase SsuD/methylene tetrahydromethanopterin reductase-like flavin-dependent oxidoreductase (luciferase family)
MIAAGRTIGAIVGRGSGMAEQSDPTGGEDPAAMADRLATAPTAIHPWVADGTSRIRWGTSIYPQPVDWAEFLRVVRRTEELGYDGYFAYDHPTARADCWTALAALATATERIRLGTMVGCIYYRSPYLLARQVADVDRLSGGRVVLALGIGDAPDEFANMGLPYPPAAERQEAMVETIAILRALWSGEPFSFAGRHFAAKGEIPFLPPVQRPHVPILLAGGGERVTLRQVARYADAANFGSHVTTGSAFGTDDVRRKYDVLRGHCAEAGRPYDAILRSHFTMPLLLVETPDRLEAKLATVPPQTLEFCRTSLVAGTPEDAIRYYRDLAAAGVQYFVANILDGDWETIELLATAVMPAFAEYQTGR